MASIVIRIHPATPVSGAEFTNYLTGLRITAFDVSNDPSQNGQQIGIAAQYAPPFGFTGVNAQPELISVVATNGNTPSGTVLPFAATTGLLNGMLVSGPNIPDNTVVSAVTPTSVTLSNAITAAVPNNTNITFGPGIAQHWELLGPTFAPVAVATALINVPTPLGYENVRLTATRTSGASTETIPLDDVYFNVQLDGTSPTATSNQFQILATTSLYITLPAPPLNANAVDFTLPADGTPPNFDLLMQAIRNVLNVDPGGTLPDLGTLRPNQCRTIAYEIVWGAQQPLPAPLIPKDTFGSFTALEDLYTNPPNDPNDGDNEQTRQKFEGDLKGYYATRNAIAERLTSYVYAVAAAVACEELSLGAAQALIELPVGPGSPGSPLTGNTAVVLTGLQTLPAPSFGIPAAFFYALAATTPPQVTPEQRYKMAVGETIDHTLAALTAAIHAGVITDAEPFATSTVFPSVNAAQSARRLIATGLANTATVPLAPLGTVAILTTAATTSGTSSLPFASTVGIGVGMSVSGTGVPTGTTVAGVGAASVTLSGAVSGNVPLGTIITFTPSFTAGLQQLVQEWLDYPPTPAASDPPSSETYEPSDDATQFWPGEATAAATAAAFLDLVLCALTHDYIIPPPDNTALGTYIAQWLPTLTVPSGTAAVDVATLAQVSADQWASFFKVEVVAVTSASTAAGGTSLPFTSTADITVGMAVHGTGVASGTTVTVVAATSITISTPTIDDIPAGTYVIFQIVTSADTPSRSTSLPVVSTTGIVIGMSVGGPGIARGTTVTAVLATTVTISIAVSGTLPAGTTLTFANPSWLPPFTLPGNTTVRIAAFIRYVRKFFDLPSAVVAPTVAPANAPPTLQLPATFDPIQSFVTAYGGGFVFGTPLVDATVAAAVASVFPGDPAAQAWLEQTVRALNDLCLLANVPTSVSPLKPSPEFSVAEALYARGFTSVASVVAMSQAEFQDALRGTVAFDQAATIYAKALTIQAATVSPAGPSGPFHPINPGSLTDCIPPCHLSPLGPVEYLHELLQLSEASTCDDPFAPPATDHTTLEAALADRRGPIGTLLASRANLEFPLPRIDIVNECLEFMGSTTAATARGTVYNTSGEVLASHELCPEECCHANGGHPRGHRKHGDHHESTHEHDRGETSHCHDPATLFAALPEYSSPATPVDANSAVEPAVFDNLKRDFSSCCLPYSQALDVSRTYLRHFCSSRFDVMRAFRKCITEFVLDPEQQPLGFQDHLWRYPVRIDTAIEYLCITPEEYTLLFEGAMPQSCAGVDGEHDTPDPNVPTSPGIVDGPAPAPWQLYGFAADVTENEAWTEIVVKLPDFLTRTCLTYCDFLELWKSDFVPFSNGGESGVEFPECEPCCLDELWLVFPDSSDSSEELYHLILFIRLWRKLRNSCKHGYTFAELADICRTLHLFDANGIVNPDFIRQLAAFQMLRDEFHLALTDRRDTLGGPNPEDRTHLLALWAGTTARKWDWAVDQLLERVERYAESCRERKSRKAEFIKLGADDLDALSRLVGFDPNPASPNAATDNWHARPSNTLRFTEVLAKIEASDFHIGEIRFLFTVEDHVQGDDPFPLEDENEAFGDPLNLPEDDDKWSLWVLREKLLHVKVTDDDEQRWTWPLIEASLRQDFGYNPPTAGPDPLTSLAQHLFPNILQSHGVSVTLAQQQYRVALPPPGAVAAAIYALMWNPPPDGPLHYDPTTLELWTQVPLEDEAVIDKLDHLRQLTSPELQAVQDLYFLPRVDLAPFTFLFPDFLAADKHLIQEPNEDERWRYFRRRFALTYERCRVIASHLAAHVDAVTDAGGATESEREEGSTVAWLLLRNLFADENKAKTPWEDDSGQTPSVTWTPQPNGGAFAALLGLTGTGLLAEFSLTPPDPSWHRTVPTSAVAWREARGPLSAFDATRNARNCPVPTILPAMDLTLGPSQLQFVAVRNGLATQDEHGVPLGGDQEFSVRWSGILLVERDGTYDFRAGAPTPDGEAPDVEAAEHRRWRLTIERGQRTWLVLNHHWPSEEEIRTSSLPLRRGAYRIIVDFTQPEPDFSRPEGVCPQRTGFEVKYCGPDSEGRLVPLPLRRLFRDAKDDTLAFGLESLRDAPAKHLLELQYTSTLRDIRRTYQRAFKALLFAHRFQLSATPVQHYGESELGYMLGHPDRFAGASYFRNPPPPFSKHAANFDFNFLPVKDAYLSPATAQDQRAEPSDKRTQALFDWWERMYDYVRVRELRASAREHPLWLLFYDAAENQPDNPAHLLRHMDVDFRHAELALHYYQDQTAPVYEVTAADLEDDRWMVRAWHADEWIRGLLRYFCAKDITTARPDLWASDDPSALVTGEGATGNANLSQFLRDGCLENGEPRRYEDVKRLNDCLRERARDALLAYLCILDRIALPWGGNAQSPKDLSSLLLLDVEAGICERASRIEEAITAVQNFVRRARLGLEPGWTVTSAFALLWDRRFATFQIWQACKCRETYKENWIEWDELRRAQRVEAFRFLESELRRSTLTIAVSGGLEYWPDQSPPAHPGLTVLQKRDPSSLLQLSPPREGLGLLGTPERDARPSWLAALSGNGQQIPSGGNELTTATGESPVASVLDAASGTGTGPLPFWMEAAIRLGVRFYRIAAGGPPPASAFFEPRQPAESGCCVECGCEHEVVVDEYYFWLIDSRFFKVVDHNDSPSFVNGEQDDYYQAIVQESTQWHEDTERPKLLDWRSSPLVRLAWCRVHNGEFKQPRRSYEGIQVVTGTAPDLTFLGRVADSLVFTVSGGVAPTGFTGSDAPGFRYDLATDAAVVLPLVVDPATSSSTYPSGLPAYPYFIYVEPGAAVFPPTLYSPALAVACSLRVRCRFEAALKWYELTHNPLKNDNTWIHCIDTSEGGVSIPGISNGDISIPGTPNETPNDNENNDGTTITRDDDTCCDSTQITDAIARARSVTLLYLETLLQWGDTLMRRNNPEAFQQARLIFDTAAMILGPCPREVIADVSSLSPQTVSGLTPLFPPLNPRLLEVYSRVDDRLELIHHCLNSYRLRNGRPKLDMPYWGDDPCCGCHPTSDSCTGECRDRGPCVDDTEWCLSHSPYRFLFLVQKAQELAGLVRELGAALLAAFEKGDAEYLSSLRASQEVELLNLTRSIRQDQWREADWQRQGLQKAKEIAQTNRRYYTTLIQNGLNNGELQYENLIGVSLATHTAANVMEGIAEAMDLIPDLFVGFPCQETWLPLGTKLAGLFKTIARITNVVGDNASTTASLDLTQAGWARRLEEWVHQVEVLDIEVRQIERQILAAERRCDQALRELSNQQRQTEQSKDVQNFLRDKFTSHELFLHLQKETAALHYRTYELALHTTRQAERAFNFERGTTGRTFLPCELWDNLHEGLLAGERLQVALRAMEKEYLDLNVREYELTKHISLRLHFPLQFLQLKTTGYCEIEIPEWLYDIDHAGQYMRRIKNVTLTMPCVTGPYTGVHCRLTLLSSKTRIEPSLRCPPARCCGECPCDNEYETCPCDPRMARHYGAREAIATSSGQNDSGMFEVNFRDERYLPFEYLGAISRWRLELPLENNFFDMDTLSDVILNLNYTAREGGEMLRRAANQVAQCRVRHGWTLFDVRHEFADAWQLFQHACRDPKAERRLSLSLSRRMFPYLPCDRELMVTQVALLFETKETREQSCCKKEYTCCDEHGHGAKPCRCRSGRHDRHCDAYACGDCEAICCCECVRAAHIVEFVPHADHDDYGDDDCECGEVDVRCTASSEWPGLYYGVARTEFGPLKYDQRGSRLTFEFNPSLRGVSRIFLLCYYEVVPQRCDTEYPVVRHPRDTGRRLRYANVASHANPFGTSHHTG